MGYRGKGKLGGVRGNLEEVGRIDTHAQRTQVEGVEVLWWRQG